MAEFTFAPLTPSSFLDRSAAIFADRVAIVDGEHTFTYREINYTSGTTGRPKGVMYHHRGAYLQGHGDGVPRPPGPGHQVPVDAADVPLQRVVLHLGRHRGRRYPCLPALRPPGRRL